MTKLRGQEKSLINLGHPETRLLSRLPETTTTDYSLVRRSALTQIFCKCLFGTGTHSHFSGSGREDVPAGSGLNTERLAFEIQSSSDPAEPRQRKSNRIRRERYLQAWFQRHGLRLWGRPGIRNQRSGPTRRTRPRTPFRYQAGIRKFRVA